MISRQTKGLIRAISFHPKRALFFVATNKQILSYNLKTRLLAKKFKGLDLPKDIHIHSSGDYLMAACEDCRL